MTRDEIKEEVEKMVDEEINITNLQSEGYSPIRLETLWEILRLFEE